MPVQPADGLPIQTALARTGQVQRSRERQVPTPRQPLDLEAAGSIAEMRQQTRSWHHGVVDCRHQHGRRSQSLQMRPDAHGLETITTRSTEK